MKLLKRLKDLLAFCIVILFSFPFLILPYRTSLAFGRQLGRFIFRIAGKHRKIVQENLRHAFPEKSAEWREALVRKHFLYLGEVLANAAYGSRMTEKFFEDRVVFDEGSREIERKALEQGTGIVLISGHIGSWEVLVQYTGYVLKGGGIYKRISNSFLDRWYKKVRERSGIQLFELQERTAPIKYLKKGGRVGFVADQHAGRAGISVNFMNRPASTFRGPAQLADMSGSRMLFYSCVHEKGGKLRVRIQDLGFVERESFTDRDEAVTHYTGLWVKALEKVIRDYPEQYFWVHRRWKTLPQEIPGVT